MQKLFRIRTMPLGAKADEPTQTRQDGRDKWSHMHDFPNTFHYKMVTCSIIFSKFEICINIDQILNVSLEIQGNVPKSIVIVMRYSVRASD